MSTKKAAESVTVVLPFQIPIDGCTATVLEVRQYTTLDGRRKYIVSCRVKCGSRESPTFFLDVGSKQDLILKLQVEVSKFKILELLE